MSAFAKPVPPVGRDGLTGERDHELFARWSRSPHEDLIAAAVRLDDPHVPARRELEDGVHAPRDERAQEAHTLRLGRTGGAIAARAGLASLAEKFDR
jgi:hypothetical protein